MKKHIVYLFSSIILIVGLFVYCIQPEMIQGQTQNQAVKTTSNVIAPFWIATDIFDQENNLNKDFWADLFLWEDGTGYIRISQANIESRYYGTREVSDCTWAYNKGKLVLKSTGSKSKVIATGKLTEDRLYIDYTGSSVVDLLKIVMKQAPVPPYGTQWELPDLYGTWRMVQYADIESGIHTVGKTDRSLASQIIIDPRYGAKFWLVNGEYMEMEYALSIGQFKEEKNGNTTWLLYNRGPLWKDCENTAWSIELRGSSDSKKRYFITYAHERLLLKQEDDNEISLLITAEYERVENAPDEAAYKRIISLYKDFAKSRTEKASQNLLNKLTSTLKMDDKQFLYELDNSILESRDGRLGYAMCDLNGDGKPELLILSEDYTIHAIYTLRQDKPVLVGAYWSRKKCIIDEIGILCVDSSSGASDSSDAVYFLNSSGELKLIKEKGFGARKYFQNIYPYNPIENMGLNINFL